MATILVCDDDEGIRELLAVALELDHDVVLAVNGRDALEQLEAGTSVDIMVLDAMMPELDGVETLRRLRADPEYADLPVVMLSARVSEHDLSLGFGAGADEYVTKPFDPAELETVVNRVLSSSAEARRAERSREPGERASERAKGR